MVRKVQRCYWLVAAAGLLLLAPATGQAKTYTYKVKHLHAMGGCQGQLVVGEQDVRYETDNRPDARIWTYSQIKKVERRGSRRLVIFTYEDQALQFGRDKPFDFDFLDGQVSDELVNFMITRLSRPPQTNPPDVPPSGRYELAVKHRHTFGGCEGTLKITDTHIEYVTRRTKDARLWSYLRIKRIQQPSLFRLDIHTFEDQALKFGRDKVFRFELKEPLEPVVYEFMQRHLNR
ncbi:MAG: hypothetical protein ACE5IP_03190 [Terriglobia bacterium]